MILILKDEFLFCDHLDDWGPPNLLFSATTLGLELSAMGRLLQAQSRQVCKRLPSIVLGGSYSTDDLIALGFESS